MLLATEKNFTMESLIIFKI